MSKLDVANVQSALTEVVQSRLEKLESFSSIASTNTYLMSQPAPAAGRFQVALADHQTSGRGRHSRRWISAPGAGLCLSLSYTFVRAQEQLPSLTLAIGVGVVESLRRLGVEGVSLKWPNDIVALDGKLGGILTEVQSGGAAGVTVVTGIGINVDLPGQFDFGEESDWAHRVVDLQSITDAPPDRESLAGAIIETLHATFARFEASGAAAFLDDWQRYDWLLSREITVDLPDKQITGRAAGIDETGALVVDTAAGPVPVISGSIVMAGPRRDGT